MSYYKLRTAPNVLEISTRTILTLESNVRSEPVTTTSFYVIHLTDMSTYPFIVAKLDNVDTIVLNVNFANYIRGKEPLMFENMSGATLHDVVNQLESAEKIRIITDIWPLFLDYEHLTLYRSAVQASLDSRDKGAAMLFKKAATKPASFTLEEYTTAITCRNVLVNDEFLVNYVKTYSELGADPDIANVRYPVIMCVLYYGYELPNSGKAVFKLWQKELSVPGKLKDSEYRILANGTDFPLTVTEITIDKLLQHCNESEIPKLQTRFGKFSDRLPYNQKIPASDLFKLYTAYEIVSGPASAIYPPLRFYMYNFTYFRPDDFEVQRMKTLIKLRNATGNNVVMEAWTIGDVSAKYKQGMTLKQFITSLPVAVIDEILGNSKIYEWSRYTNLVDPFIALLNVVASRMSYGPEKLAIMEYLYSHVNAGSFSRSVRDADWEGYTVSRPLTDFEYIRETQTTGAFDAFLLDEFSKTKHRRDICHEVEHGIAGPTVKVFLHSYVMDVISELAPGSTFGLTTFTPNSPPVTVIYTVITQGNLYLKTPPSVTPSSLNLAKYVLEMYTLVSTVRTDFAKLPGNSRDVGIGIPVKSALEIDINCATGKICTLNSVAAGTYLRHLFIANRGVTQFGNITNSPTATWTHVKATCIAHGFYETYVGLVPEPELVHIATTDDAILLNAYISHGVAFDNAFLQKKCIEFGSSDVLELCGPVDPAILMYDMCNLYTEPGNVELTHTISNESNEFNKSVKTGVTIDVTKARSDVIFSAYKYVEPERNKLVTYGVIDTPVDVYTAKSLCEFSEFNDMYLPGVCANLDRVRYAKQAFTVAANTLLEHGEGVAVLAPVPGFRYFYGDSMAKQGLPWRYVKTTSCAKVEGPYSEDWEFFDDPLLKTRFKIQVTPPINNRLPTLAQRILACKPHVNSNQLAMRVTVNTMGNYALYSDFYKHLETHAPGHFTLTYANVDAIPTPLSTVNFIQKLADVLGLNTATGDFPVFSGGKPVYNSKGFQTYIENPEKPYGPYANVKIDPTVEFIWSQSHIAMSHCWHELYPAYSGSDTAKVSEIYANVRKNDDN